MRNANFFQIFYSSITLEYFLELLSKYFWLIPIFITFIFLIISFITDMDLDEWGSILLFFGLVGIITGVIWYLSSNNIVPLTILIVGAIILIIGFIFKVIEAMWDYQEWRIFGIVLSSVVTITGISLMIFLPESIGLILLIFGSLVLLVLIIWLILENISLQSTNIYSEEISYEELTVRELKDECQNRGLTGYSRLRKNELISLLGSDENNTGVNLENIEENIQKQSFINAKAYKKINSISKIMLDDIAGLDDAKKAIYERVILPIKHRDLYEKYKKKIGGGILLFGLPGTGKTMFAQAVANELDAAFYEIKCSDVMSKWYGETEQKVKELFKKAKSNLVSVIFFDEFDAIGKKRSGNDEITSLVPELLSQLQGFEESKNIIIPLAATNRPWDIDSALLRPGRFDEKIYIPLPDNIAREFIIKKELNELKFDNDNLKGKIVQLTEGYNGSDIVEFCEQVKMIIIRKAIDKQLEVITDDDIRLVSDKVKSSVSIADIDSLENYLNVRN